MRGEVDIDLTTKKTKSTKEDGSVEDAWETVCVVGNGLSLTKAPKHGGREGKATRSADCKVINGEG